MTEVGLSLQPKLPRRATGSIEAALGVNTLSECLRTFCQVLGQPFWQLWSLRRLSPQW
jgi:hypothetical protein